METFNINILVNKVTVLNIKRVLYIIKQISNKYVKNKLINQRYLYILMMTMYEPADCVKDPGKDS